MNKVLLSPQIQRSDFGQQKQTLITHTHTNTTIENVYEMLLEITFLGKSIDN